MDVYDVLLRLALATFGAMLLGLDREMRAMAAGVRTHGLIGLSAGFITVSALMLYEELGGAANTDIDPLRVVQGLAQAIGFIAAGAIFVSRGDVHNLTSAATLWLAAAIGIGAGAGQFMLTWIAIGMGVVLLTFVRVLETKGPGTPKAERLKDDSRLR